MSSDNRSPAGRTPYCIIEVKRGCEADGRIMSDLVRLARLKKELPNVRTFMYLISEASRPKKFVSKNGKALSKLRPLDGAQGYFKVRKVCKSAHAFDSRDTAQYACLFEVYHKNPNKSPK
jgi:hypothetical protein